MFVDVTNNQTYKLFTLALLTSFVLYCKGTLVKFKTRTLVRHIIKSTKEVYFHDHLSVCLLAGLRKYYFWIFLKTTEDGSWSKLTFESDLDHCLE